MGMTPDTLTARRRSAPTATTIIILMRVRHMATMVLTGSLAASSSARVHGSVAVSTGIADITGADFMDVAATTAGVITDAATTTVAITAIVASPDVAALPSIEGAWAVDSPAVHRVASRAADVVASERVAVPEAFTVAAADFTVAAARMAAGIAK